MYHVHINASQRARLASIRAFLDEGERRFDFWSRRETQTRATQTFGEILAASGLRAGNELTDDARARLLLAAGKLAPNGNISRRLSAPDPSGFDRRLQSLLFGQETLPDRLAAFLETRGTGLSTASALLCAYAPQTYPLITRPTLQVLALTPQQRREALAEAAKLYGFPNPATGQPMAAQSLWRCTSFMNRCAAGSSWRRFPRSIPRCGHRSPSPPGHPLRWCVRPGRIIMPLRFHP